MYRKRAVLFALDAIISVDSCPDGLGYRWTFDPRLPGLLRDYKASGNWLIGMLDPSVFGLDLEGEEEHLELVAYINALLAEAGGPELDAIHITSDITDPRPIWDLRRRFGFKLRRSTVIATGPRYEVLRKNSGIGHLEWAESCLAQLYPQAEQVPVYAAAG